MFLFFFLKKGKGGEGRFDMKLERNKSPVGDFFTVYEVDSISISIPLLLAI